MFLVFNMATGSLVWDCPFLGEKEEGMSVQVKSGFCGLYAPCVVES